MALPQAFGAADIPKVIPAGLAKRPFEGDALWVPFQVDPDTGGLLTTLRQPFTTGSVTLKIPTADDIDTDVSSNLDKHVGLDVRAFMYGFETVGDDWDRIRALPFNADAITAFTNGVLLAQAAALGFNGTTYDRIRSGGTNADNQATTTLGALNVRSFLFGFDGATFDRVRVARTNSDIEPQQSAGVLVTQSVPYLWSPAALTAFGASTTTFNRERSNTIFMEVLALEASTATRTSIDPLENENSAFALFEVRVDVLGSASLTFNVRYLSASAATPTLFTATISATGRFVFGLGAGILLGPAAGTVYTGGLSVPLPREFSVEVVPSNAVSNTYGVTLALNR